MSQRTETQQKQEPKQNTVHIQQNYVLFCFKFFWLDSVSVSVSVVFLSFVALLLYRHVNMAMLKKLKMVICRQEQCLLGYFSIHASITSFYFIQNTKKKIENLRWNQLFKYICHKQMSLYKQWEFYLIDFKPRKEMKLLENLSQTKLYCRFISALHFAENSKTQAQTKKRCNVHY